MAAEDDGTRDDKSAGAQRKGRARRQRPPVTIDLTAERVADTSERVGDEAPIGAAAPEPAEDVGSQPAAQPDIEPEPAPAVVATAAAPSGTEEPASEPQRITRPPGASAIGSDDSWTRLALAGVAGGVVALILLVVLQAIGLVPSPGRSAALQAAAEAKAASEAATALDRRLSAVEMIAQNLPTKNVVDVLGGQIAQLHKEVGALATQGDLTVLDNKLNALTKRVDALPPGVSRDDLAALADRVARLEAGGAAGNGGSGAGADAVVVLSHRIDQVQSGLNTLGDRMAALEGKVLAGPSDGASAAIAIAIVALRRAVDEGVPFITDLDLAAALGLPADDIAALKPYAEKGVMTKAALAAAFADVGDAIVQAASQANSNPGFFDRLLAGIGSLVTVRPAGPVAGDDPAAIVSRMRAAVDAGDFASALSERNGLPEAGKAVSADWAAAAGDRVTIDGLLAKIAEAIKPPAGNGPT